MGVWSGTLEELVVEKPMDYNHLLKYYTGKRVFITGHTGFKGTWLLKWLNLLGAEIKGYSLDSTDDDSLYCSVSGDKLCQSIIADIQDKARLINEINSFQPDFIFHLAAQPLVRLSYEIPSETFAVNAAGTAYLLDAVRLLEKSCSVILITTDKVYENREWDYPYREVDRLGGYDPYSASKACAELIISSYRNSFFNANNYTTHRKAVASVRAGNVIGGGDWAKDRIIPDIIRALRHNKTVQLRNPVAVRPWQHVLEPLGGYLHLGTKMIDNPLRFAESWNFGPNDDDNLTVEQVATIAVSCWGSGTIDFPPQINAPHEAGLLKLDISKTKSLMKWKPKYDATTAIHKTIDWYHQVINGQSGAELMVEQITDFIND